MEDCSEERNNKAKMPSNPLEERLEILRKMKREAKQKDDKIMPSKAVDFFDSEENQKNMVSLPKW